MKSLKRFRSFTYFVVSALLLDTKHPNSTKSMQIVYTDTCTLLIFISDIAFLFQ